MTEWMDNVEMAIAKVSVIHFLRWCWFLPSTRCVPAKSTPRQSSRGRRTTSSPSARTWNELRLRGLWIDLTHRSQLSNEDPNSGCLALKDSYSLDEDIVLAFYVSIFQAQHRWSPRYWWWELRWLTETLETLMKERAADEQKAESQKLKQVTFSSKFGVI